MGPRLKVMVTVFENALLGGIVAKPVILTVDDPEVLRAVERDPRRRYAREDRVSRASSGASTLETPGTSCGGIPWRSFSWIRGCPG